MSPELVFNVLTTLGLVREVAEATPKPARAGRPGILLELMPDGACFVGVEIGVEHVTTVRIDLLARVIDHKVVAFDGAGTLREALTLVHQPPVDCDVEQLMSRRHPALAFLLTLFLLSLGGIPPTGGFWAKYFVFATAVQAGQDDTANFLVAVTSVTCIAVLLGAGRLVPGRVPARA